MDIKLFKKSKNEEMILALYGLIDNWEDEVVEFKEAGKIMIRTGLDDISRH